MVTFLSAEVEFFHSNHANELPTWISAHPLWFPRESSRAFQLFTLKVRLFDDVDSIEMDGTADENAW
jgi:hypothetical protein